MVAWVNYGCVQYQWLSQIDNKNQFCICTLPNSTFQCSHLFPTTFIKEKLYITPANISNDLCVVISEAYHTRRRFAVTNDSVHYHTRSGFPLSNGYSCCSCVKQISLHMVAPLSIWLLPYIWLLHLAMVAPPSCMVAPPAIWLRLLTIWLRILAIYGCTT